MKIAYLNLGSRVSDYSSVPSAETISIKQMLEKFGYNVDIISDKRNKYAIAFEDVKDINNYDIMLVNNGPINFFGGIENPLIINNYKLMHQFTGKIFYLLTDLMYPFRNLWPAIKDRNWGYSEEEFTINKLYIVSQNKDLDYVRKIHQGIECIKNIIYFPLDKFRLVNDRDKEPFVFFKNVDLIYGGSYRSGNRENKMIEYLFDTEYSCEFFGTARKEQFKKQFTNAPTFTSKVCQNEFIDKVSEAYGTIVIGDKHYNNFQITPRVWESMLSDAICFIDNDFDLSHSIMNNDWFYVNNKKEVKQKLEQIKNDEDFRLKMLEYQHNRINELFNEEEYKNQLKELLEYEN